MLHKPNFLHTQLIGRLLREPLLHFVLLALALFAIDHILNPVAANDPRTIVVDRTDLLRYLQNRSRAFDQTRFGEQLDSMPDEDLQRLVHDYVKEEALYREAKAMELDRTDYLPRLRMIQQLKYILEGFLADTAEPGADQVEAYYEEHRDRYFQPAEITFTHVFFNEKQHGARAKEMAQVELARLNDRHTPFHEAPAHGDRFLYQVNYAQVPKNLVASHFGANMAAKLFMLDPDENLWRGPFRSLYGWHLVMVTSRSGGHVLALNEVRERVVLDATQARREAQLTEAIASIIDTYHVRIDSSLRSLLAKHS